MGKFFVRRRTVIMSAWHIHVCHSAREIQGRLPYWRFQLISTQPAMNPISRNKSKIWFCTKLKCESFFLQNWNEILGNQEGWSKYCNQKCSTLDKTIPKLFLNLKDHLMTKEDLRINLQIHKLHVIFLRFYLT